MSFFSKVKSFFTKKSNESLAEVSSEEKTEIIPNRFEEIVETAPQTIILRQPTAEIEPYWLANEDALRDEGVIFGLSESKPEEKIAVIKTYFSHQTANLEKEVENLTEKIGELNLFLEQKESRITELSEKTKNLDERQSAEHSLLRTSVGLLLSLAMCAGNYYLIDESIKTTFPQNHYLIAIGVFLAGMFNLFNKTSFFHEKGTSISWRQILEEIGMPLAASIFVFVQVVESQSFIRAFALFIFVFFLFLFAGKLMLSNLTLIKSDMGAWLDNLRLKSDKVNKVAEWEEETLKLKAEMDELRIQKWQIVNELKAPETELARLNGKRDMLIKLFESEYNLARTYREKLTSKQIKQILE